MFYPILHISRYIGQNFPVDCAGLAVMSRHPLTDIGYRRLDVDIAMEGVMFTENLIRRAAVKVETLTFSTSFFTLFF